MRDRVRGSIGDAVWYRLGSAALGCFAGAVFGLLIGGVLVAGDWASTPLERLVAASSLAGAMSGLVQPRLAFGAIEALVWFAMGGAGIDGPPDEGWLRGAWLGGIVYLLVFMLAIHTGGLLGS